MQTVARCVASVPALMCECVFFNLLNIHRINKQPINKLKHESKTAFKKTSQIVCVFFSHIHRNKINNVTADRHSHAVERAKLNQLHKKLVNNNKLVINYNQ